MSLRHAIDALIYQSALTLDAGDFQGFLELCVPSFQYTISTFSPEIRKDMVWLEHDREGLKRLFETLSRHNSDPSPFSRHITVYRVEEGRDGIPTTVTSFLQVFRTTLDGGFTSLYAVGKLYDQLELSPEGPRLSRRHIRLDTRMLGIGTHIPF